MIKKQPPTRAQVFEEIRSRIITLEYLPGAAISETELAQQLNVSRTPIREALVLLNKDQLIEVFPRRGTFVTKIDLELVHETQFLREAIELSSMRSITHIDEKIIAEIDLNLRAQEIAATAGSSKEFFSLDEKFHELLLNLAGHHRVWKSVTDAKPHLDRARYLGFQKATPPSDFYQQHKKIVTQLRNGNIDPAVNLLSTHLRAVFADTNHALQLFPEFFVNEECHADHGKNGSPAAAQQISEPHFAGKRSVIEKLAVVRDYHRQNDK
ncbi:GntR family transcriptional regulator [Arcanobacterium hippocoleae]|uniref:DNA-binding GntR family transcriptional regulator n=1 Tax=Arcanobacterium hippocoleae TaxID=149017 RepID=A0ABU1T106_9ACTO|nr:GntR family transcriptional regulator [Arcanobacterium hippocoleae]MDR6939059.1 DNA-binding GntR family transcriptional regulator [Arcanobacterium hippocoleae]